jgi:four helix bundle protein
MFDHEKLDAYRLSIAFVAWAGAILDEKPRRGRPSVLRHLEESSTSIALNIAEGNGKRSVADRVRYLEIARGSALECAACLDVVVVRNSLLPASRGWKNHTCSSGLDGDQADRAAPPTDEHEHEYEYEHDRAR